MSHWVCRHCVITHGLRGSDLPNWPDIDDEEAQFLHIERVHHTPVQRANETRDEALRRFKAQNPEAGGPHCRCPSCVKMRSLRFKGDAADEMFLF